MSKRSVGLAAALGISLLVLATSVLPARAQGRYSGDVIPGRYILTLHAGVNPASVATDHGITPSHVYHRAVNGLAGPLSNQQLAAIKKDSRVRTVEPDRYVSLEPSSVKSSGQPAPTPPPQNVPTGIRRIAANQNFMGSYNGTGSKPVAVNIAVIDTGIDLTHPDLNVVRNVTFIVGTKNGNDDNGHGSHCAGIMAAKDNGIGVVGVAPGASLWAVKVLDRSGSGSLSSVISGIDFVTQNAASIRVANMSLGLQGTSAAGDTALHNAVAAGVTFCVAAGNNTAAASSFWPASNPDVICVSALSDYNGAGPSGGTATAPSGSVVKDTDDTFASYSNYGQPPVDICAPGTNIYSTYKGGSYATLTGTSMATPHVTGSAALFVAYEASVGTVATPQAVKNALVYNGKAQSDATFGLRTVAGVEPILYSAVLTPAPAGYVAPL